MRALILAAVALCGTASCQVPARSATTDRPFPIATPTDERSGIIVGQDFSVALLDFDASGDVKSEAAKERVDLTVALPAIFATELKKKGRFIVREGGSLRLPLAEEIISEKTAAQHVDGYFSGTITSISFSTDASGGQVCFDVRLSNSHNFEVLFSRPGCTSLKSDGKSVVVDRTGVVNLAGEICDLMKQVEPGRVLSASDRQVVISRGKADGVQSGLVALIRSTGNRATAPAVRTWVEEYTGVETTSMLGATDSVVGEVYVTSVEQKRSTAFLYRGEYAVPGDTVIFK